jgi:hypothetical protein
MASVPILQKEADEVVEDDSITNGWQIIKPSEKRQTDLQVGMKNLDIGNKPNPLPAQHSRPQKKPSFGHRKSHENTTPLWVDGVCVLGFQTDNVRK